MVSLHFFSTLYVFFWTAAKVLCKSQTCKLLGFVNKIVRFNKIPVIKITRSAFISLKSAIFGSAFKKGLKKWPAEGKMFKKLVQWYTYIHFSLPTALFFIFRGHCVGLWSHYKETTRLQTTHNKDIYLNVDLLFDVILIFYEWKQNKK